MVKMGLLDSSHTWAAVRGVLDRFKTHFCLVVCCATVFVIEAAGVQIQMGAEVGTRDVVLGVVVALPAVTGTAGIGDV